MRGVACPAGPSAHAAKRCGTIAGGRYRVRARIVSCDFALRWSRAYIRYRTFWAERV